MRVASLRPAGGLGRRERVEKEMMYSLHVSEEKNCGRTRIWSSITEIKGRGSSGGVLMGGKLI